MTHTHTYAILEVGQATYDEIAGKLREAGYNHAFTGAGRKTDVIDMHGIALQAEEKKHDLDCGQIHVHVTGPWVKQGDGIRVTCCTEECWCQPKEPSRDRFYCTLHTTQELCPNGVCHQCKKIKPGQCCTWVETGDELIDELKAMGWQPMSEEAKKAGEVLVYAGRLAVAHWCEYVEDHPPIAPGWYYWSGSYMNLLEKAPTRWMRIPVVPR